MKPMRILHVLDSLNRGGAESMLMNYYRKIDKNRFQFDFVVHHNPPGVYANEIKKLGGQVFYVPKFRGYNIISCLKAWSAIFHIASEDNIVQGHMPSTAGLYLALARYYGRYAVVHAHSSDRRNEDGCVRHVTRLLMYAITRHVAEQFYGCSKEAGLSRYGKTIVEGKKFRVWHNAVDYNRFQYSTNKRILIRQSLGISKETIVIGHVGRLTWAKNHDFLLQVFNSYHQKHMNSILLLVGDGERREELNDIAKAMGLKDVVVFAGGVSNVEDYMSAMDVFVFPSHYEGLSTVNIEAQVNGLPCIVSEFVPKEIKVSVNQDQVAFLPLAGDKPWVTAIDSMLIGRARQPGNVIDSNYDINSAVRWAEQEYICMYDAQVKE